MKLFSIFLTVCEFSSDIVEMVKELIVMDSTEFIGLDIAR